MMRIYVGNLSFRTTDDQLRDLFAQVGEVQTATILSDRDTGRSRGFGFVEMDPDAGQQAIERFNGYELDGRMLKVNEARPRPERSGFGGGRPGMRRDNQW